MKHGKLSKKIAVTWLIGLLVVALGADFLANDRPLIASIDGETRFPVLNEYGKALGWASAYQPAVRNWYKAETAWAVWPPVPYSAGATDMNNSGYRSPFAEQNTGQRARHYLGTDQLGRDVLAGLIAGARVAAFVGLGALLISLLLGVPLGGIAGYFSNDRLQAPRYHWWGWGLGGLLGILYAFVCLFPFFRAESAWFCALLVVLAFCVGGLLLRLLFWCLPPMRKPMWLPTDTFFLQSVELFVNIPALVLLIALVAVIDRPSLGLVIVLIGVLRWTSVGRYLRAEFLRIRNLPYIEAARISGVGRWRILFQHALPNALGPLFVVSSFGIGAAILLEAFLSFLGIGIPADQVTWGSLLSQSRAYPAAWWLALFPGLLLTFTVLAANLLGERE